MSEGVLILEKRCVEERGSGKNVLWRSPWSLAHDLQGRMRCEMMAAAAHVPMVWMHLVRAHTHPSLA